MIPHLTCEVKNNRKKQIEKPHMAKHYKILWHFFNENDKKLLKYFAKKGRIKIG